MNEASVSGDSKIVCGAPMPNENSIDIPPKKSCEKVIEEGEVVIMLAPNLQELVMKANKQIEEKKKKGKTTVEEMTH